MLKPPCVTQEEIDLLRALIALRHSDHGKVILKYLEAEKRRLQDKNDKEDDSIKWRQRQGANQTISKFLEFTEQSNTRIATLL